VAQWNPPSAGVESAHRVDNTTYVGLRLPDSHTAPLAPASLVRDGIELLHLDAVVEVRGNVTVFRTEQLLDPQLVGQSVGYQQWWTPEAFDAVADPDRQWTRQDAPEPKRHEHCLLDATTIEAASPVSWGWRSGEDWMCPACYQRFVIEDHLGVREQ
jgi:hypothetical protein